MHTMKPQTILAFVTLIVTTYANPFDGRESFGDDNPKGKWLPLEDGFVWPGKVERPPKVTSANLLVEKLPEDRAKALRTFWPEDSRPKTVSFLEVDLNEDGKPELLFNIPAYGGSGGPFYEILTRSKEGVYKSIGSLQGWGFQIVSKKNGWFQIRGMSRAGGGQYTRYLLTFDKKAYIITRNEGHNFNTKKVTVRTGDK